MVTQPGPTRQQRSGAAEFFQATRDFRDQHTALYDFAHPMTAAMWNLRWQVAGYVNERPAATEAELWARFVQGTGIEYWKKLRKVFVGSNWDAQEREIVRFVLIAMTAVFEGWTDEIVAAFSPMSETKRRQYVKGLQFPGGWMKPTQTKSAKGAPLGARDVVAELAATRDPALAGFRKTLRQPRKANPTSEKYSWAELDALLTVFRYFKEVRNSISHRNGRATDELVHAQQEISRLTLADLRLPAMPEVVPVNTGDMVSVSLSSVRLYSDVILRIVLTVDAELSDASSARAELARRWHSKWPSAPRRLHPDHSRWPRQAEEWFVQARLPVPDPIQPVVEVLRSDALAIDPTDARVRDYERQRASHVQRMMPGA